MVGGGEAVITQKGGCITSLREDASVCKEKLPRLWEEWQVLGNMTRFIQKQTREEELKF